MARDDYRRRSPAHQGICSSAWRTSATPSTGYDAAFAYLAGHETDAYHDFLRLFVALLRTGGGRLLDEHLAELTYHLTDDQRQDLRRLAAAGRLTDAAIAAEIGEEQYHAQKARRFGTRNPERQDLPFGLLMVRRGWTAYQARVQYDTAYRRRQDAVLARWEREQRGEMVEADEDAAACVTDEAPVWCFARFGISHTRLPDGRALCIAGEHEDFYDPDFCIYNDVIVLEHDLCVAIYGYPEAAFPPTDFHTATLVGDRQVYIIGNLGYLGQRRVGATPVYRLDTTTLRMEPIDTDGDGPGWLSRHTAAYVPARHAIEISGGQVYTERRGQPTLTDNRRRFWLDLTTMTWSRGKPPLADRP